MSSYSQSLLDTLIFKEINQYRKSLNISELKWNNELQAPAEHHSSYLRAINFSTILEVKQLHLNPIDQNKLDIIRGHDERNFSFEKRQQHYNFSNEVVFTIFGWMSLDEKEIAETIVDGWILSESHKEVIKSYSYTGISSLWVILEKGKETESINTYIVTTMIFK
jgi:uncharacterized protein YkwD